jgi:hypothetical protein
MRGLDVLILYEMIIPMWNTDVASLAEDYRSLERSLVQLSANNFTRHTLTYHHVVVYGTETGFSEYISYAWNCRP